MTAEGIIIRFLDRDKHLSPKEITELSRAVEKDADTGKGLADQLLMDDLISRALCQERSNFSKGVLQGIQDIDEGRAQLTIEEIEEEIVSRSEKGMGAHAVRKWAPAAVCIGFLNAMLRVPGSIAAFFIDAVREVLQIGLRGRYSLRSLPCWLFSAAVHAVCIIIAAVLIFSVPEKPAEKVQVRMAVGAVRGIGERDIRIMGAGRREVIIPEHTFSLQEPDIIDREVFELDPPEETARMHRSRIIRESLSIVDVQEDVWFDEAVEYKGIPLQFKSRRLPGRRHAILRNGGNQATESAVLAALMWLARHQEADGHWDSRKWGAVGSKGVGWGDACFDESVTGLAVLAFLGAGHTSRAGKFRDNVKRAVDWIISKQRPEGNYSTGKNQEYQEYDSAICTLALVEEYGMTRNPLVRDAAEKGVNYIINKQKPSGGWAHTPWDSTSVLGWMVMALKSAKMARINVPQDTFDNAIKRLDSISDMDDNGYPGLVGYSKKAEIIANRGLTMTAVGMLAYQFLGAGDKTDRQAEMIIKHPPVWEPGNSAGSIPQNFYHWYYATLGIFQYGGGHWKIWNKGLQDALLPNQRQGGPMDGSVNDVDGSWDPVTRYDNVGGRAYSTAMGALCLEVYYRYDYIKDRK